MKIQQYFICLILIILGIYTNKLINQAQPIKDLVTSKDITAPDAPLNTTLHSQQQHINEKVSIEKNDDNNIGNFFKHINLETDLDQYINLLKKNPTRMSQIENKELNVKKIGILLTLEDSIKKDDIRNTQLTAVLTHLSQKDNNLFIRSLSLKVLNQLQTFNNELEKNSFVNQFSPTTHYFSKLNKRQLRELIYNSK